MLRRNDRFAELIARQLDLLQSDEAELLREAEQAEAVWNAAGRDEAEEAYGDFQLVVDAIGDRLLETRDAYAASLAPDAIDEYRASFNRAAARRFRRYPTILADLGNLEI
jgi:cytochrome P450